MILFTFHYSFLRIYDRIRIQFIISGPGGFASATLQIAYGTVPVLNAKYRYLIKFLYLNS